MRSTSLTACAAICLLLGACSALQNTDIGTFLGRTPPPVDVRGNLTPEALQQIGQPILLLDLEGGQLEAGALASGRNGTVVTWATTDGVTVSLDRGVVTATRGFGDDLMSSDVSEVKSALFSGRREAVRGHAYLTGEDEIERRAFVCSYENKGRAQIQTVDRTYDARQVVETCNNTEREITNTYWIDGSGKIRRSEQWVSPLVGSITYEVLND